MNKTKRLRISKDKSLLITYNEKFITVKEVGRGSTRGCDVIHYDAVPPTISTILKLCGYSKW